MSEILNLANAILILGITYFGYQYGWTPFHFLGIAFAVAFWAYHKGADEDIELKQAEAELIRAKIEYYRRRKS
jgi:hypothetical protein